MSPASRSGRKARSQHKGAGAKGQSGRTKASKAALAGVLEQSSDVLASQLAEAHPELEELVEPDDDGGDSEDDDPDGVDDVVEYGEDLDHTDGDSSELGEGPGEWDRADSPGVEARRRPDLIVRPCGFKRSWTVELVRPSTAFGLRDPELAEHERRAQRDASVKAIGQAVLDLQQTYLETGRADDLQVFAQKAVADRSERDETTVSRLLKQVTIELPDGRVVALSQVAADTKDVRIRAIAAMFREQDVIDRDHAGRAIGFSSLVPKADVLKALQSRFPDMGNRVRNIEDLVAVADLPLDPPKRKRYYLEGRDWWATSF